MESGRVIASVPRLTNAGLGNSLLPMCKAYLASKAVGTKLLVPFQFDTRRRQSYFNHRNLKLLPYIGLYGKKIVFSYQQYLEAMKLTGTDDYYTNVKHFVSTVKEERFYLINEGMWGGFHAIRKARNWVLAFLLSTHNARKNVAEIGCHLDPDILHIAVHIRRRDFLEEERPANEAAAVWNRRIPLDWYMNVAHDVRRAFGRSIKFLLFTDDERDPDIGRFIKAFNPLLTFGQRQRECSDVLLMSKADLLICSQSSFSMWGAFLSENNYLMYLPYMAQEDGSAFLWDEDIYRSTAVGYSAEVPGRGFIALEDGHLPNNLISGLEACLKAKSRKGTELIFGGRIRVSGS